MNLSFPDRFFITGTDTDIGKTVVAAMLAKGLGAAYFKPIQSGTEQGTDAKRVRVLTELPSHRIIPSRYTLQAPRSPHEAARLEARHIDIRSIHLPSQESAGARLVVEGAGGLLVPLNDHDLMIDLIQHWRLPVVLVAPNRLGAINQTLLSLEALALRSLPVVGVILNQGIDDENARTIAHFGKVPVLAQIPELSPLSPATLTHWFHHLFAI